jgi:hypothetical protein
VIDRSVGDKACALVVEGAYAEFAAVPATRVLPVPDGMDLPDAAGSEKSCSSHLKPPPEPAASQRPPIALLRRPEAIEAR